MFASQRKLFFKFFTTITWVDNNEQRWEREREYSEKLILNTKIDERNITSAIHNDKSQPAQKSRIRLAVTAATTTKSDEKKTFYAVHSTPIHNQPQPFYLLSIGTVNGNSANIHTIHISCLKYSLTRPYTARRQNEKKRVFCALKMHQYKSWCYPANSFHIG